MPSRRGVSPVGASGRADAGSGPVACPRVRYCCVLLGRLGTFGVVGVARAFRERSVGVVGVRACGGVAPGRLAVRGVLVLLGGAVVGVVDDPLLDLGQGVAGGGEEVEPAGGPGVDGAPGALVHGLLDVGGDLGEQEEREAGFAGEGPMVNPVPEARGRHGQHRGAHHNRLEPPEQHRRAPLRQKTPALVPRGIPDRLFDQLFATMGCDRDRALLAFYVSTGARASELLGVTVERVDAGRQLIGVERKGSGRLQWIPASTDAFVWLRLCQGRQVHPAGETALWLTRRAPPRPLSYPAMRRVLQRANDALGTSWTLHQLRHTAAQRMVADPLMSLTDVQWVLATPT